MLELKDLTIKKAQKLIHDSEISCRELVSACLENIAKKDKEVHAYLEVFEDAFKVAEEQDKRLAEGEDPRILTGIPFAMKDNLLIKGKIASSASRILENYRASYDATVVKKLREAGAIFIGRTNMDEFAMGSSTENSAFGVTKNPYDMERVAGGSSGGSAAALAMDGCLGALGSDTGGSIRQPASFCGLVGLKPTYGAVSRYGLMAMASSLDQIGPFAKTVEDAEIVFNVIKGKDEFDSTSVDMGYHEVKNKKNLKIGLLKYDKGGVDREVNESFDRTVEKLRQNGHEMVEVEIPHVEYSLACYYIIMPAEVSSNLARFDGVKYGLSVKGKSLLDEYLETRGRGFGRESKRRIMLGTYVLSSGYYDEYYGRAQKMRVLIRNEFKKIFEKVDIILSPTTPTPSFKIGEKANDPIKMYLEDIFTVTANLAGIPAMSIPAGFTAKGLPLSVQLTAPWFAEKTIFELGKEII